MTKQATIWGFIAWMILFSFHLHAQNKEQRETLLKLSETFEQQFTAQKAEAVQLAEVLKIPVRFETKDGQVVELMRFENGAPVYYITHNAGGANLIKTDQVYPGGIAGLNLTGAGQTLGIWDGGKVLNTHQELNGRVIQMDGATTLSSHSTHVAGTMIGAGIVGNAKGMSYQANLNAWDWDNDYAEIASAASNGLKVSQHSYGYLTGWYYNTSNSNWYWYGNPSISQNEDYLFGFYDSYAQDLDQIAYNAPYYLHVKSASNDRGEGPDPGTSHFIWNGTTWVSSTTTRDKDGGSDGYDCISRNALSKNILTVGAVSGTGDMAYFSGWGPTDDGRVKPDVVAKGVSVYSSISTNNNSYSSYSGTSMSGPMVSGSIGLLHQHHQNLHPGTSLRASTVKALIIHSADDMISGAPGPDYRFGWGLMDTQKAAEIMSNNALYDGIHIQELTLTNGQEITIQVKANGGEPLRATIVWTDLPGTPVAASLNPANLMLVNDLDLRTIDPSSTTLYPYILNPSNPSAPATTGDNFRDNVEMIHIASPVAQGIYEIKISHKGTLAGGSQQVSLIISGNQQISSVSNPVNLIATTAGRDKINLLWSKNLNSDDVMLAWSESNSFGTPATGTVYQPGQSLPGGGTVLYRGSLTAFEHTGLSAATTYYYKAYSFNQANEYSSGRIAEATTQCFVVSTLPFSENFATAVTIPTCWEIADNQGNGQAWQFGQITGYTPNPNLTPNYAYLNSDAYGSGNSQNADLITPTIDLSQYTNVSLSFSHFYRHYLASVATLYYSINNGASWVQVQQWISTSPNPETFNQVIPALSGRSQVKFKWNFSGTFGYYWAVDNVLLSGTLIEKPIVTTVSASATSEASGFANGNVTNQGTSPVSQRGFCWSISPDPTLADNHVPAGSGPGAFSAEIAGLQAGTTYYVRAYATNLSGTSYGDNKSFTTFCPDGYTIPYSENFTGLINIPNCWFRQNSLASPLFHWMVGSVTNGVTGSTTPYAYASFTGGTASSAMLVSPAFDFTGYTSVTISFRHRFYLSNTGAGVAAIEYSTDGGLNWTIENSYTSSVPAANYSKTIAALAGQSNVRFRWRLSSNATANNRTRTYSFDDLSITATPTNLYADFSASKTNAYFNEPVVFTDASGSQATSWSWDFGSGAVPATANTKGPHSVSYSTTGLKTVMLTVNGNVVKTKTNYISVTENAILPPRQLAGSVNNHIDVSISWLSPRLNDGFEHYSNFNLNFGSYIQHDLDNSPTFGLSSVLFSNMYYTGSFIVFDPYSVSPPLTTGWEPLEGKKYAACFSATTPPNNDWLITPPVKVSSGESFSFYTKSYTATYGLERFKVGVSVSGTQPEDFTIISTGNYLEAPTTWTKFSFDLSAYENQIVHLAIICVSNDAFVFMVDKLMIEGGPESDQITSVYNIPEPEDLIAEQEKTTGIWVPVTTPTEQMLPTSFGTYNVYRNGNLIGSTSDFSYSDPDLAPGVYNYSVTANYFNPAYESGPSNVEQLVVNTSIWKGTLSQNWFADGNWSGNKTPTANDHVIIPYSGIVNFPVVSNDLAECMDLTIEENASVVASETGSVTCYGMLTNESGTTGIIIKSNSSGTGSLIHNTFDVEGTIERYIPAAGYHLVSTPITQASNPTSLLFLWSYLFKFDVPGQKWVGLSSPTNTPLFSDQGYMIYKYGVSPWQPDTTYRFAGALNSGSFACNVAYPDFPGNHSLVPNPYPSAIDWDAPNGWTKQNLSDAIWIWNPAGSGNYAAYVAGVGTNGGTNIIPVGQAFFVQANGANPTLVMDNAVRLHSTQPFFKNQEQIKDLLRVKALANNSLDEIVIRFSEVASQNFDSHLDASKMYGFGKTPQLYSVSADNEKLSINSLPFAGEAFGVPVGFQIDSVINVVFEFSSVESFDPEIPIFMWDMQTGIMVNLKTTSSYSFTHNPGGDPMRFLMMFNSAAAVEELPKLEITAFIRDGFLHLTIPYMSGHNSVVNLYDASGRLVLTKNTGAGSSSFNISGFKRGVYMVQVVGQNETLIKKIIF